MPRTLIDSTSDLAIVADDLLRRERVDLDHDGYTLTLHTEPDEHMSIMDEQGEGVWCGRLEYATEDRYSGHYIRPDWADGGAELLRATRGYDAIWWRPLDDCLSDRTVRDAVRRTILDLLESGYVGCWVELTTPDAVYASNSMWGLDEPYPELIGEQISECLEDYARDFDKTTARVVDAMFRSVGVS